MADLPESNLTKKFKDQANELEANLFTLNKLFELCCDSSLSEEDLLQKATPLVEELAKSKEVLISGDQGKIKAFFMKDIERRANL